jgi:tetratricopeptide (TPR) repeat protein
MNQAHQSDDYIVSLINDLRELDSPSVLAKLRVAALAHPADPRPLLLLAGEFASSGAYDQAEAAYIGALQRDPRFALASFQLGLLQYLSGRTATASASWDALSVLPPEHEYRLFQQGLELLAQNRSAEAQAALRAGIAANQSNAPLNQDMQRMLDRIAASSHAAAEPAAGAPSAAGPDANTEHFLVSAYRNAN